MNIVQSEGATYAVVETGDGQGRFQEIDDVPERQPPVRRGSLYTPPRRAGGRRPESSEGYGVPWAEAGFLGFFAES